MNEPTDARRAAEQFLTDEAALLDAFLFDDWLATLARSAIYEVRMRGPLDGASEATVTLVAEDYDQLCGRVRRLSSPLCHAERPRSRTRRLITNVRARVRSDGSLFVQSYFHVHRWRDGAATHFVGTYEHDLERSGPTPRIVRRTAVLDVDVLPGDGRIAFLL